MEKKESRTLCNFTQKWNPLCSVGLTPRIPCRIVVLRRNPLHTYTGAKAQYTPAAAKWLLQETTALSCSRHICPQLLEQVRLQRGQDQVWGEGSHGNRGYGSGSNDICWILFPFLQFPHPFSLLRPASAGQGSQLPVDCLQSICWLSPMLAESFQAL